MGNWEKQQEERKETKEKEKLSRETLGKYFYDLSKLTFTALVLGGIISFTSDTPNWIYGLIIIFGSFSAFILAYAGFKILKA